ncbi:MAG: 16S rRNA (cytosine(967)-C(5))-methyltransferase, partial [Gammaproteobacteria bacterium]|nr:16S rRNA (cytosine(967)-C(5))-methyltransferase [Gammaproteobacteria bacterium]
TQIEKNITLQSQILDALWPLLASGGKLLYATCSVLPDENEAQMTSFISRHADAIPESLGFRDPEKRIRPAQLPIGIQILPGRHELDGFYYARLRKT